MITFIYNFKKCKFKCQKKIYFYNIRWARSNNLLIVAAGKEEKPALSPTVGEGNFK